MTLAMLSAGAALASCGDQGPAVPAPGTPMMLVLHGLRALDAATEGRYALWASDRDDAIVWSEAFDLAGPPRADTTVPFEFPAGASRFVVTVEPPGDDDDQPSRSVLLTGALAGDAAVLRIEGAVTTGLPLEREPGHHSLFTSSNNVALGYPSFENAGLWLFSISVVINKHGTREVKLAPLSLGWIYEGWIVREPGTPNEVWIPYGKYRPDERGLLTSRDNTGSGPFSGDADFRNGGVEDVPGDEWTTTAVANQLGLSLPGGLSVPLALDSVDTETGAAIWYHAITIEPIADEDEPLLADHPFLLRPYRNPIGAGGPGTPRRIVYLANDPTGEIRRAR